MAGIKRFEEIRAWQKARELVRQIYLACGVAPFSRDFGLRDQICRAAVSTMSNVAEGFGRKTGKDFAHFLDLARGSALEVQSLLYVARDLNYIQPKEFDRLYALAEETISLIGGFTSYLRKQASPVKVAPNSELQTQNKI